MHALKSWASHLQNAFVRDQNHLCNELIELSSLSTKQNNATQNVWNKRLLLEASVLFGNKKTAKTFCKCFCFSKTSSSWKRFRSVFVWKNKQYLKLPHFGKYLKLPHFGKYLKLPHFGKYLKLPYFVKCNQLFTYSKYQQPVIIFGFSTNATSTKCLTVMGGKRLVHSWVNHLQMPFANY